MQCFPVAHDERLLLPCFFVLVLELLLDLFEQMTDLLSDVSWRSFCCKAVLESFRYFLLNGLPIGIVLLDILVVEDPNVSV